MKYFGYIKNNPYICSNKRTDLSFSYLLSKRLFFLKGHQSFCQSFSDKQSFFLFGTLFAIGYSSG